MTKSVLGFVTLGTLLTALIAAPSFTPAFAMGGGGTGAAGVPAGFLRLDPPQQPSSQQRPPHIKSSHKIKKTRHSGIRQPGT